MKRLFFSSAALLLAAAASADTYPYLSFQRTDGTTLSVSAESLTLTFTGSGSTLVASNGSESHTLSVSDLAKMYFSANDETAISDVTAADGDTTLDVYTASGIHVGKFSSRSSLSGAVEPGIYLVKQNGKTQKIAVK